MLMSVKGKAIFMKFQEYLDMFQTDEEEKYVNLVIPADDENLQLDVRGKSMSELSLEDIVRVKRYSAIMFAKVDKTTL